MCLIGLVEEIWVVGELLHLETAPTMGFQFWDAMIFCEIILRALCNIKQGICCLLDLHVVQVL